MELGHLIQAFFSLVIVVLGIILIGFVIKKLQTRIPRHFTKRQGNGMEITGHMVLDPHTRLVAVRWKDKEHLLCLGSGNPMLVASEKITVSEANN